ncbi:acyl-oxidase family protein [Stylonychia lemnae]|uniref:Acyl-oxidase family protein n=1 Tax=Stylonychia lemnae TaxID=5949 RepID=A0A077ZSE5_STYLE|nr:acyl-oxidase family protein [Stylonychia lemnae]|eukprot:CDW72792.1 acyl-oxidase family protein [Stylonychia lemnae]
MSNTKQQEGKAKLPYEQTHEYKKLTKKIQFKTEELQRFYYDILGVEKYPLEKITEMLNDGKHIYSNLSTHYYHSRENEMKDYMRRFAMYQKYIEKKGYSHDRDNAMARVISLNRFNLDYGNLYLHIYAFIPAIELLGSEEQVKYWVPLANDFKITGSYAQTELGHGSDVQGLQTSATYDVNTKEIVFNSPTIESTKFWPGGLGKSSTHAVVYAQLISQGKKHGVHAFIIQIRDLQTHKPLQGIEVGDVGSKIALVHNDNGYLRFNNFRVAKSCHLSKYVDLSDDGTVTEKVKDSTRLVYGGMLKLRVNIVKII